MPPRISNSGQFRSDQQWVGNSFNTGGGNVYFGSHAPEESVDRYDFLSQSLTFNRIDDRVHNIKKALPKTCIWFVQNESFKEWRSEDGLSKHDGFLWIKGKPGCGKSTIMKTALEWLRKEAVQHDTKIFSYFFNGRAPSSLEKSSLGLYRSLTYQLLESCPAVRPAFILKFALKEPGGFGENWTESELQDFLDDVVVSGIPLTLYIFIDALDEGEHEDDVREMIGFLSDLAERALSSGSCRLRICLSSRYYPRISIRKGLSLNLEEQQQHSQDIDLYIHQKLIGLEGSEKDELCRMIATRASNVFLWVVLVVDILNKIDDSGGSLAAMTTALNAIPRHLHRLFQGILTKTMNDMEASILLLQWVLFSQRVLTAEELYLAVEYSRTSNNPVWSVPSEIKAPPRERLERYILDRSLGLVELTAWKTPTVQFIHETVREFLIEKAGLTSLLPSLSENLTGLSHETLKTSCARYLTVNPFPSNLEQYVLDDYHGYVPVQVTETLRTSLPFIDYTTRYLFEHAELAQRTNIGQDEFLKTRVNADGFWCGQERLYKQLLERRRNMNHTSQTTLLYFATEQGYSSLCRMLIEMPCSINARCGRYGSVLAAACVWGDEQMVRSLIRAGADVNLGGGEYGHCLIAAIENNRTPLVPILIEHGAKAPRGLTQKALFSAIDKGLPEMVDEVIKAGANVNKASNKSGLPFSAAMNRNFIEIAGLLLQNGADIDGKAQHACYGYTALQLAVREGNEQKMQMLLDAGADINVPGTNGETTLQVASSGGHAEIVKLLIKLGADIKSGGGSYGNPLRASCAHGHEKVVRILLNAGADINTSEDSKLGSAIRLAAKNGHEGIVRMLLDAGAYVDAPRGPDSCKALSSASLAGHEQIVKVLLDAGADVNAEAGYHYNALHAASRSGKEKIVKLLLDAGADVNARAGHSGNALDAASQLGNENIVKLLLDAGADVNAEAGCLAKALESASKAGNESVVRLLLDACAVINTKAGHLGNALEGASRAGNESIVRLLLDVGADVNSQGGFYGSALQAASTNNNEQLVKLLLDAGADVNIQGGLYGSALQAASTNDNEELVKLLLDAGAEINVQGGLYSSALQTASRFNREKVVEVLLIAGADVNARAEYSAQLKEYNGTPLQIAVKNGNKEIEALLRRYGARD